MAEYQRHLYLPRGKRSFRIPATTASLPLIYLGWGKRRFGREPVPLARTLGWAYAVVTEGAPRLLSEDGPQTCPAGTALLLDSESPFGWTDEPGAVSGVLVWIWRNGPKLPELQPPRRARRRWHIKPDKRASLEQLHRKCRNELAVLDGYSSNSLRACQEELDVAWARAVAPADAPGAATSRFEACLDWMRHNLSANQPVTELGTYLNVSEATLQRLFHHRVGRSPQVVFQALKAEEARRLLGGGMMVKEVAYRLGYRHPNDLSRFYKKAFGTSPSTPADTPPA